MKKLTLFVIVGLMSLTSCSFESYQGCPAYSSQNKATKHGNRAQAKYTKKNLKRHSLL